MIHIVLIICGISAIFFVGIIIAGEIKFRMRQYKPQDTDIDQS